MSTSTLVAESACRNSTVQRWQEAALLLPLREKGFITSPGTGDAAGMRSRARVLEDTWGDTSRSGTSASAMGFLTGSVVCDVSFDEMAVALSYMSLVGGAAASASAPAPAAPGSTAKEAPKAAPATAPKVEAPAPAMAEPSSAEVAPVPSELPPAPTEAPPASADAPPVPKATTKNVDEDDDVRT